MMKIFSVKFRYFKYGITFLKNNDSVDFIHISICKFFVFLHLQVSRRLIV